MKCNKIGTEKTEEKDEKDKENPSDLCSGGSNWKGIGQPLKRLLTRD